MCYIFLHLWWSFTGNIARRDMRSIYCQLLVSNTGNQYSTRESTDQLVHNWSGISFWHQGSIRCLRTLGFIVRLCRFQETGTECHKPERPVWFILREDATQVCVTYICMQCTLKEFLRVDNGQYQRLRNSILMNFKNCLLGGTPCPSRILAITHK